MGRQFSMIGVLAMAACQPVAKPLSGTSSAPRVLALFDQACVATDGDAARAGSAFDAAGAVRSEGPYGIVYALDGGSIIASTSDVVGLDLATRLPIRDARRGRCSVFGAGRGSPNARNALLKPYANRPDAMVTRSSTSQIEAVELPIRSGRGVARLTAISPPVPTGRANRIQNDAGTFAFPEMQDTIGLSLSAFPA